MTVIADAKKRVAIPHAAPGDVFDVQLSGEGKVILTKLAPVEDTPVVKLVKKNGFMVLSSADSAKVTRDDIVKAIRADRAGQMAKGRQS